MKSADAANASTAWNGDNRPKAWERAGTGYGSPTPEEEMPATSSTNPGSPDPTVRGQQTDSEALDADQSLGGSDGQFRDEKDMADPSIDHLDPAVETPLEAPSTDADLADDNAGPTRPDRESFSSESDEDASGR
jgi:hypothetical protein